MTRAQIAILWVLGVMIVAIVAVLGYIYSFRAQTGPPLEPATPPAPPTATAARVYKLPATPYSAKSLYASALQSAQVWQPDATLVSASTSWPFAKIDALSSPADWTFQFYSPRTHGIYVINVSETLVTPVRETLSPYPMSGLSNEEWQLDSNQALNAWLSGGGGDYLLEHPVVDISARLVRSQEGAAVWAVIAADRQSDDVYSVSIDASSGTILP
jgi:hypothetical protein